MINTDFTYILASASPRRRELLTQGGFSFSVIPSSAEENITKPNPSDAVIELALTKAESIYKDHKQPNIMIIGADTIVVYDNDILGKPKDEEDAYNMLSLLSDRTHQVYTGVALITNVDGCKNVHLFYEVTQVTFYPLTDAERKSYISTGDPMDKAGAYGIQGPFAIHVKSIVGDYNNVVGLPLSRLYQEIKKIG